MDKYERPDWDTYFMNIVREVAKRGTCDRGRTGAILVRDKRILATGYVGAPKGMPHCDEEGHELVEMFDEEGQISKHCVRTSHAEMNALAQAVREGVKIDGSTVYCKLEPCYACAKILVNAGIKRVVCEKRYHGGQKTRELFKLSNIQLDVLSEATEQYADM